MLARPPGSLVPPLVPRLVLRAMPPLACAAGLWWLSTEMPPTDLGALGSAIGATPVGSWVLACLLTGASFACVGRTDRLVHAALGTGVAPRRAGAAGMQAVALSQTLGFGAVTGAFVRWRHLPELAPARAALVTGVATLAFLLGVLVLAGAACVADQGPGALAATVCLAVLARLALRLGPARQMPGLSPALALRFLLWTAADLSAAAMVLAALLSFEVEPVRFLLAYLCALGLGLLSQSPGGVGVFEATLVALLPEVPEADLLAAMIGYRLVYHALPAAVALLLLLRPASPPACSNTGLVRASGATLGRALARAPQAEWGLVHQGAEAIVSRDQSSGWLVRRTGGWLVALGLPLGRADLAGLEAAAAREGRGAALYKCDGCTAAAARAAGWQTLRLGSEAVLDLDRWTADTPACRQLRRKLRAAQAAGLGLTALGEGDALPLADMAEVARDWAARHGGERGFSMGLFDPAALRHQRVVLAWRKGTLVGFASFHVARTEWTLDLMRQSAGAPDGTMHAAIAHAASLAREAGAARLSLAAIPAPPGEVLARVLPPWLHRRLHVRMPDRTPGTGPQGLAQFKGSFGPRLAPRYAAANGALALALALAAVARAVRRPDRPRGDRHLGARLWAPGRADLLAPRSRGVNYSFEGPGPTCDGQRPTPRPAPAPRASAAATPTRRAS